MPRPLTPSSSGTVSYLWLHAIKKLINWWAKGARPIADIPATDRETTRLFCNRFPAGEILSAFSRPSRFWRQHRAHIGLGDPELSRYAGRRDSRLKVAHTALTSPCVNATLGRPRQKQIVGK